jgi:hypothetical protein
VRLRLEDLREMFSDEISRLREEYGVWGTSREDEELRLVWPCCFVGNQSRGSLRASMSRMKNLEMKGGRKDKRSE